MGPDHQVRRRSKQVRLVERTNKDDDNKQKGMWMSEWRVNPARRVGKHAGAIQVDVERQDIWKPGRQALPEQKKTSTRVRVRFASKQE
jgi:hypothetical protein